MNIKTRNLTGGTVRVAGKLYAPHYASGNGMMDTRPKLEMLLTKGFKNDPYFKIIIAQNSNYLDDEGGLHKFVSNNYFNYLENPDFMGIVKMYEMKVTLKELRFYFNPEYTLEAWGHFMNGLNELFNWIYQDQYFVYQSGLCTNWNYSLKMKREFRYKYF